MGENVNEEKELLESIKKRIDGEKKTFLNKTEEIKNGNCTPKELFQFVEDCAKRLEKDMHKSDVNSNTESFFLEMSMEITKLYAQVFYSYPEVFEEQINNKCNAIASSFQAYERGIINGTEVSNNLKLLYGQVEKFQLFINTYGGNEKFRSNPKLSEILGNANKYLDSIKTQFSLISKFDVDKFKEDPLAKRQIVYINNLSKAREEIKKRNPEITDKDINVIIERLNVSLNKFYQDVKNGKISSRTGIFGEIENIIKIVKKKFGYNIDKDDFLTAGERIVKSAKEAKDNVKGVYDFIHEKGVSKKGASSNVSESTTVVPVDVETNSNAKYVALATTMKKYREDLNQKIPFIIDNSSNGVTIEDYDLVDQKLEDLINQVEAREIPYDYASRQFYDLVDVVNKKFGYSYNNRNNNGKKGIKSSFPRRRKVVSVSKLGLGVGGLAIGAVGIGGLISETILYAQFGYLYLGISPFVLPVLMTMISGIMLKKAFSSKEKGVVLGFVQKLKGIIKREKGFVEEDEEKLIDVGYYGNEESNGRGR